MDAVWRIPVGRGWGRIDVEAVQRAHDSPGAAVEDVDVDHRGRDVAVAEELLDGPDVVAGLEEMGGEGVTEGVTGDAFGEAGTGGGELDGALEHGLVDVGAAPEMGRMVKVKARGGEEPLPRPLETG